MSVTRTHPARLRVMIGSDTYAPHVNGAATFTGRLARGLAARGHEVHVVAPATGWRTSTSAIDGVVEHRVRSVAVPGPPLLRAVPPGAGGPVRSALQEVRPDVVHVQGHFGVGRTLLAAARSAGVATVATNHFMPDNLLPHLHLPAPLGRAVARWAWADFARVVNGADAVTAPTPVAADLARAHGVSADVRAISCGTDLHRFHLFVDPAPFRARHHLPQRPTVAFVGRLDAEKHVDELLRAFAVVRSGIDAHLLVVGQGHERAALEALAIGLGVEKHVTFAGYVADEDLPGAYAAAQVCVNPGTAELQSIATLEAMATGKPVVGADARALPLLVREGVNGHLFAPGDVAGLAGALTHLLTDDVAAEMMGLASLRLVAQHDVADTVDAFEALYAQVIAERGVQPAADLVGARGAGDIGDAGAGGRS